MNVQQNTNDWTKLSSLVTDVRIRKTILFHRLQPLYGGSHEVLHWSMFPKANEAGAKPYDKLLQSPVLGSRSIWTGPHSLWHVNSCIFPSWWKTLQVFSFFFLLKKDQKKWFLQSFLSHAHNSITRLAHLSICQSVGPSVNLFLRLWVVIALLLMPKCMDSLFYNGPCPPAHN